MNPKPAPANRIGAVIVAAGESRRMDGIDKIFHPLNGKPLICCCLSVMNRHPQVSEIVLVVSAHSIAQAEALVAAQGFGKVTAVCAGGSRRQDSVRIGLDRLPACDWVIVHDGARPFADDALLSRGIAEAMKHNAACAAVPVKDTIKSADCHNFVTQTLPRQTLWAAQTPQVFNRALLAEAHRNTQSDVTDDASMVEAMGYPVRLFMGSYNNIKVTTPEDLTLAQAILDAGAISDSGCAL